MGFGEGVSCLAWPFLKPHFPHPSSLFREKKISFPLAIHGGGGGHKKKAGDVLLSHTVTRAVPSTQKSLTSEFGMGSGVASLLLSPARLKKR